MNTDILILMLVFSWLWVPLVYMVYLIAVYAWHGTRCGVYMYRIEQRKDDDGNIHYLIARNPFFMPLTEYYTGKDRPSNKWSSSENGNSYPHRYAAQRFTTRDEVVEKLSNLVDQRVIIPIKHA